MSENQHVTALVGADLEPLDQAFLRSFCAEWYAAWNAQDYERVVAMCTDDVEWRDPTTPEPQFGRAALGRVMAMLARACPDYQFEELEPAYASPTHAKAIVRWRFTGTMTGELEPPGFAPTGRRIEVRGDDHWEFCGGLLCRCEVLYDLNAIGVHIGAAPAPGTRGEKFAVLLQHLAARRMRRRGNAR